MNKWSKIEQLELFNNINKLGHKLNNWWSKIDQFEEKQENSCYVTY